MERRNAAETRSRILNSARKLFAERGYDGVGVREIAAGAGVTAMLVNRYFGSKERLFGEAAKAAMDQREILTPENVASADFASAIAHALVRITGRDATPTEGFRILSKSAGSKEAVRIGRILIEKGHYREMRQVLRGRLAPERAGVLLALISGFQMMRQTFGLPDLVTADEKELAAILASVFELLVNPGSGGRRSVSERTKRARKLRPGG